jgi:hypothetical protein
MRQLLKTPYFLIVLLGADILYDQRYLCLLCPFGENMQQYVIVYPSPNSMIRLVA